MIKTNNLKKVVLGVGMALIVAISTHSNAVGRLAGVTRDQMVENKTEASTEQPHRYQILEVEEDTIRGTAINHISEENSFIFMWKSTVEDSAPIVHNIQEGDFIEVDFEDGKHHLIEDIRIIENVLEYEVTQIDYYDNNKTDGYMFLQPYSTDTTSNMGIHFNINADTLGFIDSEIGDYMDKYSMEAIEERDMILFTVDQTGISRILGMY